MVLLSEYAASEYLLSLMINHSSVADNSFLITLKKNYKTLKTTSVISTKRNIIYEFKLNDEYYVLKHFFNKNSQIKDNLLEEDNFEQVSFNYFDIEKEVLQKSANYLPRLHFADNQSKTIIMEKLIGYKEFYELFSDVISNVSNDYRRKYYLKNLASTLKTFHSNNINNFQQNNSKNIIMIGELKNNEQIFKYYKDYYNYWEETNFIHGDIFSRNILVNKKNKDLKIIDWEMATLGDVYFDLSIIINILFDCRLGTSFTDVYYPVKDRAYDYDMLKKDINDFLESYFLDAYKSDKDRKKVSKRLKTFLIINTQHLSNNVDNLIKNINHVFPCNTNGDTIRE
jgi:thiamine kinase-like enzyme